MGITTRGAIALAMALLQAGAANAQAGLPAPQAIAPGGAAPEPMTRVAPSVRDAAAFSPCLDLRESQGARGAETGGDRIYRVQRGDSLSGIAARFYRAASGYQSITRYHNAAVARQMLPGDHPAIRTDSYAIYVGLNLHLPPRSAVREAGSYVPPPRIATGGGDFELPGSGSVYPLTVTAANCTVHAGELGITGLRGYRGVVTLIGQGTGYGRDEFCRHRAPAYTASDRAKFNLVTDCGNGLPNRNHLEIAVARDAVVVVLNRHLVESGRFDTGHWPGYVTLSAKDACRLLTGADGRRAVPHFSTAKSGTLHFVGRRLCGDDTVLVPRAGPTEDYEDIALAIALDPQGMGFLPYSFYYEQRDRLVPAAIDGVRPILELAKPDPEATHDCGQIRVADRYAYCLARFLWVYADRDELLRRGGLYQMLYLLLDAPALIERAHYLPLTAEMRDAELRRIERGE